MTVLTFAQPYWLLLLVFVPLVIWRGWRALDSQSAAVRFSSLRLLEGAPQTWRVRLGPLLVLLRSDAFDVAIVAMARPQERNVYVKHTSAGIDIMLVLDTSTSMRARDFHPNRFEAARDVAAEFVRNRTSDRVGLVVFAGKAFTQAPLTIDYQFLLRMLGEAQIGVVEDGTAIGNALAMAVARLRESDAASRVVILLTDGQNNRGEIDPVTAAELARTLGSRVYTVGVGRVSGASDHDPEQLRHPAMPATVEIDEASLRHIAEHTGGQYFHAGSKEALRAIYAEIDRLEKSEIEQHVHTEYGERFALFLWPARSEEHTSELQSRGHLVCRLL